MNSFSTRLKELRDEQHLSQADLLKKLIEYNINTSAQNISNWEKGREPNYKTLIALSKVLNVSTDYLLGLTDLRLPITEINFYKNLDSSTLNLLINIRDTCMKYSSIDTPTLVGFHLSSKYIQVLDLINSFFDCLTNALKKDTDNIIDDCLDIDNNIDSERIEKFLYKSLDYDLYNLNSQIAKIFSELNSLIPMYTLSKSTSTIYNNFISDTE